MENCYASVCGGGGGRILFVSGGQNDGAEEETICEKQGEGLKKM